MSPIGPATALTPSPLARIEVPLPKPGVGPAGATAAPPTAAFGQMLDGLIATVEAKQNAAQEVTRSVLLGQNDQLHRSMIAMQEASVAFSMMIEVRNRLVESYQELMRMQV